MKVARQDCKHLSMGLSNINLTWKLGYLLWRLVSMCFLNVKWWISVCWNISLGWVSRDMSISQQTGKLINCCDFGGWPTESFHLLSSLFGFLSCLGLWGLLLLRPPQQQQQQHHHHHHHHHRDYYCDYQNKLLRPLCIYFLVEPSTKLKEHPTLLLVVDCLFCSRKGLHTTIPNLFQLFFLDGNCVDGIRYIFAASLPIISLTWISNVMSPICSCFSRFRVWCC